MGLLQVTQRGRAGNAEYRSPNHFRLTYLPTAQKAATHEWRCIRGIEAAEAFCRAARAAKSQPATKETDARGVRLKQRGHRWLNTPKSTSPKSSP